MSATNKYRPLRSYADPLLLKNDPRLTDQDYDAAILFHALSDPTRVAIIRLIRTNNGVCDRSVIAEETGIFDSRLTFHLAKLKKCGLIRMERGTGRNGRATRYHLIDRALELTKKYAAEL